MSDAEEEAAAAAEAAEAAEAGDVRPAVSPSLASDIDDGPPEAQRTHHTADQLSDHPVWQNSRLPSPMPSEAGRSPRPNARGFGSRSQRGGRRGRGASEHGDFEKPRYERISATALEFASYAELDGAESHLNSDESDEEAEAAARPRRRKKRSREPVNEADSDDESERPSGANAAEMMAAAAFGGGANLAPAGTEDGFSETSSRRRANAYKEAFGGIRGVTCVGCALATRIAPVERFVKENISKMQEVTLWKMAALCYQKEVCEPCENEGVVVPKWSWKDIQLHFTHHSTQNSIGRHQMIRSLQEMRAQAAQRLVRVDNGERELDRGGAELMLKVREFLRGCRIPISHKFPSHTDSRCRVARAPAGGGQAEQQQEPVVGGQQRQPLMRAWG